MKKFDAVLKELKRVVDKAEINQINVLQIQELEEIIWKAKEKIIHNYSVGKEIFYEKR